MARILNRFPRNDIMSLTEEVPRYDLAESVGPDIHVRDLLSGEEMGEFASVALGYGTAAGDPRLRQKIAELQGCDADNVVVTIGGMHALFLIAFILCEPGDEAVTTAPLFPNARNVLASVGAKIKTIPLSFDAGYQLDLEVMRQALSSKTRLVSLASPQNPSGVALSHDTLTAVLTLMDQICPDAYLLVDETYREAVYAENEPQASAVSLSSRVVACTSLSKCHGAPGLRLGWAVTQDTKLREQLVLGKFTTVIACSMVDEALALRVLEQADDIIGARRKHLQDGLSRTAAWVEANSEFVDWVRPDAGALCCVRLKPEHFDEAAIARFHESLNQAETRVADGAWFGDEAGVFRLGFGLMEMPDLEAGLQALSSALRMD